MRDDRGDHWKTDGSFEDEAGLEPLRFTRGGRPNANQKRGFLQLRQQGIPRDTAARAVGTTATKIKHERNRDILFDRALSEAERQGEKGGENHQDLIRGYLHEVAFGHLFTDRAEHPKSVEVAKMLADTWLPEHAYKRTKQVEHGQTAPFEILVGQRVPEELLAALDAEERRALLATVKLLEAGQQRLRVIEGGGE